MIARHPIPRRDKKLLQEDATLESNPLHLTGFPDLRRHLGMTWLGVTGLRRHELAHLLHGPDHHSRALVLHFPELIRRHFGLVPRRCVLGLPLCATRTCLATASPRPAGRTHTRAAQSITAIALTTTDLAHHRATTAIRATTALLPALRPRPSPCPRTAAAPQAPRSFPHPRVRGAQARRMAAIPAIPAIRHRTPRAAGRASGPAVHPQHTPPRPAYQPAPAAAAAVEAAATHMTITTARPRATSAVEATTHRPSAVAARAARPTRAPRISAPATASAAAAGAAERAPRRAATTWPASPAPSRAASGCPVC